MVGPTFVGRVDGERHLFPVELVRD
jgi:hypothetical protein